MKRIATYRDISVIQNDPFIVLATDSSGAIGEKEHDSLPVQIEMAAAHCLRVCLVELTAVGATPEIIISTVSNAFEPTGRKIRDEIQRQCEHYRITDYDITGSSEENFSTSMTGFGITVVGSARQLHWKQTRIGDACYLYGMPYVGQLVLDHEDALLDPMIIQTLFRQYEIHDLLPCGSGGIQRELDVLCSEMNLSFECGQNIDPKLLVKSAGPATCGIFSSSQIISGDPIQLLGHFIKRTD